MTDEQVSNINNFSPTFFNHNKLCNLLQQLTSVNNNVYLVVCVYCVIVYVMKYTII